MNFNNFFTYLINKVVTAETYHNHSLEELTGLQYVYRAFIKSLTSGEKKRYWDRINYIENCLDNALEYERNKVIERNALVYELEEELSMHKAIQKIERRINK